MKKLTSRVLSFILILSMTLTSGVSAFASEVSTANQKVSQNASTGSVFVTEDGVTINGVYYTKTEFTNLLNHAVEVNGSGNKNMQPRMAIAAGIYFIPGIGQVAIAATGAIVLLGVTVEVGTWLFDTITDWLSNSEARTIAKIRAEIPSRLRDENGDVDLGKFDQKVKGKTSYKEKGGWTIDKDETGHGGKKWKLKNKSGDRVASLGENGEVLGK